MFTKTAIVLAIIVGTVSGALAANKQNSSTANWDAYDCRGVFAALRLRVQVDLQGRGARRVEAERVPHRVARARGGGNEQILDCTQAIKGNSEPSLNLSVHGLASEPARLHRGVRALRLEKNAQLGHATGQRQGQFHRHMVIGDVAGRRRLRADQLLAPRREQLRYQSAYFGALFAGESDGGSYRVQPTNREIRVGESPRLSGPPVPPVT